jgi:hypothetical protein
MLGSYDIFSKPQRLCCTNQVMDSRRKSNVSAGPYEQTDIAHIQDHELDCLQ